MHIIKLVIVILIFLSIVNYVSAYLQCSNTYILNITSPSAFIFDIEGENVNITILRIGNSSCQQLIYMDYTKNNLTSGLLLIQGKYEVVVKSIGQFIFHYYIIKLKCIQKALCPSFLFATNKSVLIPIPDLTTPEALRAFIVSNVSLTFEIIQCNKIIKEYENTTIVFSKYSYVYFKNPKNIFIKICVYKDSLFYLSYKVIPCFINPYLKLSTPSSEGIASYGILNETKTTKPYLIKTTSILGKFNISCILAYNYSQNLVPPCSASLQLNVVLKTCSQVYWLQNVLEFLTLKHEFKLADDILNITCIDSTLSNYSITSLNGYVTMVNQSGKIEYYYGNYYCQSELKYCLPLCGYLVTNVSLEKCGILVSFAVIFIKNGSSTCYKEIVFDNVLIHGKFRFAYILVCGKHYTPIGSYYDAELVFGGGGNGEITKFCKLNATLWLFYLKKNTYVTFPNYFTFGEDTAEKAVNITVNFCKYYAKLTTGKENFRCYKAYSYSIDPFHYHNISSLHNSSTKSITVITIGSTHASNPNYYTYEILIPIALILSFILYYLLFRKR
ncbi:thermopsin [Acidianus hospitalis W1]|uniref:Thermopsin n=1 Tax=Acidianus hospitalis (strain W1) TaxID=933801 RepID=F4B7T3_ACIHW|nr:thermopsin [Acidianus hospitalis]AEE94830.1 thermopsin [Acidianus hospitalis W1]